MKKEKAIKKAAAAGTVCLCLFLFAGCHKTPDKQAVTAREGNLAEFAKAEPLKQGETRQVSLPEKWKVEEKKEGREKTDGSVEIFADVPLKSFEAGNLPIIEVENKRFTNEELKRLVDYFSNGRKTMTIVPQKAEYEEMLRRLDEKKDQYRPSDYADNRKRLERCIQALESQSAVSQEMEVAFGARTDEPVNMNALFTDTEPEKEDLSNKFSCTFENGDNEQVRAVAYDAEKGKTSNFTYTKGGVESIEGLEQILEFAGLDPDSLEDMGAGNVEEMISGLREASFGEDNKLAADRLIKEIAPEDFSLSGTYPLYYFPDRIGIDYSFDAATYWETAKPGQEFVYARTVGGFVSRTEFGDKQEVSEDKYAPPFGVETIKVEVCDGEVVGFYWNNMSTQTETVAENTKLVDFETVADTVIQKFQYYVASVGAANDLTDTTIRYDFKNVEFGYTYVPAYNKPERAWLIPAWFFEVQDSYETPGKNVTYRPRYTMINALDGSLIHADSETLTKQTR